MSKVLNLVININIITAIFSTLPGPFSFSTLRASMPTSPVLCNLFWLICLRLPSAHPHLKQIPHKHIHFLPHLWPRSLLPSATQPPPPPLPISSWPTSSGSPPPLMFRGSA